MAARSSATISSSALGHPAQLAVGVALLEQLGPAAAQPVEQLAQPRSRSPVGRPHAAAEQPAQGVVEVAPGQQLVGQLGQQLVGVEVEQLLGAVPTAVVVAGGHAHLRLR